MDSARLTDKLMLSQILERLMWFIGHSTDDA